MSWIRESDRVRRHALRLGVGIAVTAAAVARSPAVSAQQPLSAPAQQSASDPAGAEVLFNDAKKAMAAGDYESACPKLAESYRLDPGTGTLTALAVCHESQGKTATAWAEFIQVVSDAAQAHRTDRERFAKQHIAALEPKLSKLTVVVDAAALTLSGLEVRRDGILVGRAAWGTAVPVDPGDHTIEAVAKGKQRWSTTTRVRETADSQTLTIPPLEDAPIVSPPAPATLPPASSDEDKSAATQPSPSLEETPGEPSSARSQRVIGIVVGAVGLAAAGLGTYFGVEALSKSSDANDLCPKSTCSNAQGVNDEDAAKSSALASDIALGGAVVAVAVGTVLFLTAPRRPSTSPAVGLAPKLLPGAPGSRLPGAVYSLRW
jgi:hypothetical protein